MRMAMGGIGFPFNLQMQMRMGLDIRLFIEKCLDWLVDRLSEREIEQIIKVSMFISP